jgi:hypothetical protein
MMRFSEGRQESEKILGIMPDEVPRLSGDGSTSDATKEAADISEDLTPDDTPARPIGTGMQQNPNTARTSFSSPNSNKILHKSVESLHSHLHEGRTAAPVLSESSLKTANRATKPAAPSPPQISGNVVHDEPIATQQSQSSDIGTLGACDKYWPEPGIDHNWPGRLHATYQPSYEMEPIDLIHKSVFDNGWIREVFAEDTFLEDYSSRCRAGAAARRPFKNDWFLLPNGEGVVFGQPPIKPEIGENIALVESLLLNVRPVVDARTGGQ